MNGAGRIVLRADGGNQIGLGHVVRSLALAQMLQKEFTLVFAIQQPEETLQSQIKQTCHTLIKLPLEKNYQKEAKFLVEKVLSPTDVIVLDGYSFNTDYQKIIKGIGCSILCLDDIHAFPFVADAVLNQAGGVTSRAYQHAPYTKLLLGPDYALLRPPFLEASQIQRTIPAGPLKVMVNFGGADPHNYTLQEARHLLTIPGIYEIEIVIGSAYCYQLELEEWIAYEPRIKLHRKLSADEMCKLMRTCALAVTSASGIAYEFAAVGGILFVKKTAENQSNLYHFLLTKGIASDLKELSANFHGNKLNVDFATKMAIQRRYFDGKSAERLKKVIRTLSQSANLTLRNVTEKDMLLLFNWSNDPDVRRRSFNSKEISLEEHKTWLKLKLRQENAYLYIAEVNGDPAAHIRFDLEKNTALISYLIGGSYRGKGLGHIVLLKGIKMLAEQRPGINKIEGLVQIDNIASIRAFEKAGFIYAEPDKRFNSVHRFILSVTDTAILNII